MDIDPDETRRVLESEEYTDAVEADVAQARMLGANGVPFFVIDRKYGISGAQPAAAFSQALETAWPNRRRSPCSPIRRLPRPAIPRAPYAVLTAVRETTSATTAVVADDHPNPQH